MSILEELLEFSRSKAPWMQGLLRRLVISSGEEELDLSDVLAMLKAEHGLHEGPAPTPVPLSSAHFTDRAEDSPAVVLNSLGPVANANRLAGGQVIPFAVRGVTVVYGENGSGKSGYCRILKKLCRVRSGGEEPILGNAFEQGRQVAPAEAAVRFSVGSGEPRKALWRDGGQAPKALARISVFDAKSAILYADQDGKLEFLPQGLDVLGRLADACVRLREILEAERKTIRTRIAAALPTVSPTTTAGRLVAGLSPGTGGAVTPTCEEIEAESSWEEKHSAELSALQRDLLSDPEVAAKKYRILAGTIADLEAEVLKICEAFSDDVVASLREQWVVAHTAREAADLAAAEAAAVEPLPGMGREPWRLLFEYARLYSAEVYPGEEFPVLGRGARCVLCQRELDDESVARFQRFDQYIRSTAAEQAKVEEEAREAARQKVERIALRAPSEVQTILAALPSALPAADELVTVMMSYLEALAARKKGVLDALETGSWGTMAALPSDAPGRQLAAARDWLANEADRCEASKKPEVREENELRVKELQDRKTISSSRALLQARREDLERLKKLEGCFRATDSTAISRKNTELREKYLTEELRSRWMTEISGLGLDHVPLRVQPRSEIGASYVGVKLASRLKVTNREVLSQGEFRAVALACFLAEVGGIPGSCAIVVDDPVSSLDHERTRRVARRLIAEAGQRQVIVFTHDLVFLSELRDAAAELRCPFTSHWIQRTEEQGCGAVSKDSDPWQLRKVPARFPELDQRLGEIRKSPERSSEEYRSKVRGFYSPLRETWERLVETQLFCEVIMRFRLGVQTQSLRSVQVDDEDYRRVFFGMKRVSTFSGHDAGIATSTSVPSLAEMEHDLAEIKQYSELLKGRARKLEDLRKALEVPPPGETA